MDARKTYQLRLGTKILKLSEFETQIVILLSLDIKDQIHRRLQTADTNTKKQPTFF